MRIPRATSDGAAPVEGILLACPAATCGRNPRRDQCPPLDPISDLPASANQAIDVKNAPSEGVVTERVLSRRGGGPGRVRTDDLRVMSPLQHDTTAHIRGRRRPLPGRKPSTVGAVRTPADGGR